MESVMNKTLMIAAILPLSLAGAALAQAPARTIWDGVFTADQAAQGKALFDSKCAICHGTEMNGAEMAPPLSGGGFIANWSGVSVAELATRIHTTMPANDPGSLTNQEVALAIAYILSFNHFPAGATPLPAEEAAQGQIAIVADKPAGK
jgi:mono/diheme cytochrome c family protein